VGALGDKITVQESDWNCGTIIEPNHKKKPFDDVRVAARADPGDRPLAWCPEARQDRNVHTSAHRFSRRVAGRQ